MTLTSRSRFLIRFTVLAALAIGIVMLALSSTGSNTVGAQQGTVPDKPTGVVVTATHDSVSLTWEDPADSTITHYQIFRRDRAVHDPGEFVEIDSNTGSAAASYTDDTVEPEARYVYRVKAVNQHGASTWSDFVRANTPAAPTPEPDQNSPATGQPTIGGTAEVGETLTADTSGIADADGLGNAVFEYQWLAENTEVAGATSSTYTPVDADVGKTIKVRVSFTDDRDFEESLTSEATESVAAAATSADDGAIWSATMTVGIANGNSGFSAYTDLGELTPTGFTLNGTEYLVKILGESDGQFYFALNPDVQNDFRLHVGEAQFASEDASIQTKVVRGSVVAYIYEWDPGTLSLSDGDTVEVGLTSANTPATGAPTISGDAYVGETLTADVSAIDDADGLGNPGYGYQWVRYDETTDSDITGANSSTYTLVEDDADNAIKVRVSFTDDDYNPEELTSGATAAVEPAPLTTETSDEPKSHNGTDAFTFRIAFSEDISISYTVFRDDSFETTNGSITRARRVNGSSSLWEITVEPDSDADVTVVLPVTTDCAAQGAVCTSDGRKLSNSVELTVAGPRGPRGSGEGVVYTYEDGDGLFEDDDRGTATTKNSGYTGVFNGTSAAAPMVSGVAALLRQANPDLTWRDLKLILAASAQRIDSADTGWEDGADKYDSTDGAESYHFNHQYGFGMVDAAEAVALAQDWRNLPPFLDASLESSTPDTMIPDNTASGITRSLTLDTEIDFIEFVEVEVSIDHVNWRELKIEMVSPSGATSLLAVSDSTATDVGGALSRSDLARQGTSARTPTVRGC